MEKNGYDKCVIVVPNETLDRLGASGVGWVGIERAVYVENNVNDVTTAHEIAHTYDVGEWSCGLLAFIGLGNAHCNIPVGEGWNVLNREPKIGVGLLNLDPTNIIRNGGGDWIANSEYKVLMDNLVQGGDDPRILIVGGTIFENNTVELDPFVSIDGEPDNLIPGNYSFQCLSPSNEILCNASFQPLFDTFDGFSAYIFSFSIPFPEGTSKISLKKLGTTIKEILVSSNSPVVTIDSIRQLSNNTFEIKWYALDADGDNLTFYVDYTHNDIDFIPLTFEPLQNSSNIFTFTFNSSSLPGSNSSKVRITVTDGINTVSVFSNLFSITNKKPYASIILPLNGSLFRNGTEMLTLK